MTRSVSRSPLIRLSTEFPTPRKAPRFSLARLAALLALLLFLGPILLVLVYRFVPPPITPLMLIRSVQGEPIHKQWVGYDQIAPVLPRAVVSSEDSRFCEHHGFDWVAMDEAWRSYRAGGRLRGGSTLSQQTAKNLFLWPGRSFVRKGIEAYLTVLIEALWSKQRILEVYLNIVEWGHGVYGAEAAAQILFQRPAAQLTAREAALLAAVLPNPRRWAANHPTSYIDEREATILARMPQVAVPGKNGCR